MNNVLKYKRYRSILQKCKRSAKQQFYKDKCTELKNNTKKLWQLINGIINKTSHKLHVTEKINKDSNSISNTQEISNEFGRYFSGIGKKFADATNKPIVSVDEYTFKITHNNLTLYLCPTNQVAISKLLSRLPNKTSSGHDDISNCLLKKLGPSITYPLSLIFNQSMQEGSFPGIMKQADVIPLHKSKDKAQTNNYRPISFLPTISKRLEKIIYKRTYCFLENTNQIFKSQYGCRSKHSCELAVSELLSEIIKNNEKKMVTIAVYLDLSKAFDILDHSILLNKLEQYGIRGTPQRWCQSYLMNRTLRAKCNTVDGQIYSDAYKVEYGTPQGSCLGPLLFLLFTNDMYLHLKYCKCILFADDTTLYFSASNKNYIEWCIQKDLKTIHNWFQANKLTLNLNKSVYMQFETLKHQNYNITMDDYTLPEVTKIKFLGIWIDRMLTWQTHFDQICLKLVKNTQLLRISKNHLNMQTKKLIYYAHFYSHLTYDCTTWGNMLRKDQIQKFQRLQNKCI